MAEEKSRSDMRKERLAKALKANLMRRKEQARTRKPPAEEPKSPPEEECCPN
ncbi:hypothetical protein [Aestuariivirga sp.]|uniref:hypothetical protein n=1 Tax=Aestuariivirga sp. TaxID=2650926 RepID=UPI003BABB844